MACPGKWKHGPKPAVRCCLTLTHTHISQPVIRIGLYARNLHYARRPKVGPVQKSDLKRMTDWKPVELSSIKADVGLSHQKWPGFQFSFRLPKTNPKNHLLSTTWPPTNLSPAPSFTAQAEIPAETSREAKAVETGFLQIDPGAFCKTRRLFPNGFFPQQLKAMGLVYRPQIGHKGWFVAAFREGAKGGFKEVPGLLWIPSGLSHPQK